MLELLEPKTDEEVNPLRTKEMLRVFTQLLVLVSEDSPEDQITTWSEVHDSVPLCVSLVPELTEVSQHAVDLIDAVVTHAEKLAPTYVTPPPFV